MSNARFARSGWVAPTSAIPAGQGTSVVCRQSQFEPFGGEIVAADCVYLVRVVKVSSSISRQSTGLRPDSSHGCCDVTVYGWGRGSEIFSICVRCLLLLNTISWGWSYSPQVEVFLNWNKTINFGMHLVSTQSTSHIACTYPAQNLVEHACILACPNFDIMVWQCKFDINQSKFDIMIRQCKFGHQPIKILRLR
jgi:hypothetical protein